MRTLLGLGVLVPLLLLGGSLSRRALHIESAGIVINWHCPACHQRNMGDTGRSYSAVCQSCNHVCNWSEVDFPPAVLYHFPKLEQSGSHIWELSSRSGTTSLVQVEAQ